MKKSLLFTAAVALIAIGFGTAADARETIPWRNSKGNVERIYPSRSYNECISNAHKLGYSGLNYCCKRYPTTGSCAKAKY